MKLRRKSASLKIDKSQPEKIEDSKSDQEQPVHDQSSIPCTATPSSNLISGRSSTTTNAPVRQTVKIVKDVSTSTPLSPEDEMRLYYDLMRQNKAICCSTPIKTLSKFTTYVCDSKQSKNCFRGIKGWISAGDMTYDRARCCRAVLMRDETDPNVGYALVKSASYPKKPRKIFSIYSHPAQTRNSTTGPVDIRQGDYRRKEAPVIISDNVEEERVLISPEAYAVPCPQCGWYICSCELDNLPLVKSTMNRTICNRMEFQTTNNNKALQERNVASVPKLPKPHPKHCGLSNDPSTATMSVAAECIDASTSCEGRACRHKTIVPFSYCYPKAYRQCYCCRQSGCSHNNYGHQFGESENTEDKSLVAAGQDGSYMYQPYCGYSSPYCYPSCQVPCVTTNCCTTSSGEDGVSNVLSGDGGAKAYGCGSFAPGLQQPYYYYYPMSCYASTSQNQ